MNKYVILKRKNIELRDLVFNDQFESRVPGCVFGEREFNITSQEYNGLPIWINSAIGQIQGNH